MPLPAKYLVHSSIGYKLKGHLFLCRHGLGNTGSELGRRVEVVVDLGVPFGVGLELGDQRLVHQLVCIGGIVEVLANCSEEALKKL